ncbi:uncharacterized protein MKK02DRAFT_28035 [Dioszegia hungarica]|uniref:Uncharacterized protein n=1 Tax=Dioszegia hungarica TaxID=4972 RepID=A0AA38H7B9_9TREE|nr:uncharacterized protein MKK02DRAFT_28035 [Dioszegia hungarica]KAI9634911.1 hypothetical protein MKK02DRAFT_28035 [Dioszegia hungarica]
MLQLISAATLFLTQLAHAAVLAIPVTHPLPLVYTFDAQITAAGHGAEIQGTQAAGDEARRVFATRDEPASGISGGAIGGIIAAVFIVLIIGTLLIVRSRRTGQGPQAISRPTFLHHPPKAPIYPHPQAYVGQYSPPPAYSHPAQQQPYYPAIQHGQVQMPQTVHLGTRGSYYMPAVQQQQQQHMTEEQRGVRFGLVGTSTPQHISYHLRDRHTKSSGHGNSSLYFPVTLLPAYRDDLHDDDQRLRQAPFRRTGPTCCGGGWSRVSEDGGLVERGAQSGG